MKKFIRKTLLISRWGAKGRNGGMEGKIIWNFQIV